MSENRPHCYEQPLNERIRTLLRLEYLIQRLRYHQADRTVWGRRATLDVLLDVLSVLARSDVVGEISKALGQRYSQLAALAERPDVDAAALAALLEQIDASGRALQRIPAHFASYLLRDNELLNSLNNRRPIPGGSCGFDLPTYQHWLAQPDARLEADLAAWTRSVEIIEGAVALLLKLLRDGVAAESQTAEAGVFIHNTPAETQLIRVLLAQPDVFPQISAGRHRATIRFMEYQPEQISVRQASSTVHFDLACCRF